MSTPSSSTRAPGSGPGSQILSSVSKFRCLFTYDLRRKSKRWRDGYLKYHAFNKRVMVYDEHGNFVGDHHWRSGEQVQDGDELELDKGILIEVGEHMNTIQTDISNLFEKRRSSQNSPPSRQNQPSSDVQTPRPSTSTVSAATSTPLRPSISSQPFRSLNDLLGIKKGPAGQISSPATHLLSPYEQRNRAPPPPPPPAPVLAPPPPRPSPPRSNVRELYGPERSLKRQKVSADRRNNDLQSAVVDLTETEKVPESPPREAPRPAKASSSMPPPKEKPRLVSSKKPTRPDPPRGVPVVNPVQQSPAESMTSHRPQETVASKEKRAQQPKEPTKQDFPTREEPAVPENSRPREHATIPRIPMQRTRNKFMYGAILQRQSSATPSENSQPTSKPAKQQKQRPQNPAQEVRSTTPEFVPSDSTQSVFDEMDDTSDLENDLARDQIVDKENLLTRRSFDKPLRKSKSDPSALTNKPSLRDKPTLMRSAMSAVPEDPVEEEGPWTSEAQDLFDYWPKGLPRPT